MLLALTLALAAAVAGLCSLRPEPALAGPRPNIVIIQTDDQPIEHFNRRWKDFAGRRPLIMPNTMRLLRDQGIQFRNYITPFPLCAPSRVSLLSGNYAHNHGVVRIVGENGGWPAYRRNAVNRENLAVWLQRAGYRTLHFGKFMNHYGGPDEPVETTVPPGWNRWVSDATDNSTRAYYGYRQNVDGRVTAPRGWPFYESWSRKDPVGCPWLGPETCLYHTDAMSQKAVRAIENAGRRPFFLQIDYHAPHGDTIPPIGPEPAVRHYRSALDTAGPRPGGFDEEDVSDKPGFISELPHLNAQEIRSIRKEHQRSIESLRSVDDGIKGIYSALQRSGKLESTFIIFTSDNGFFLGQHRISRGKLLPYEPALRVPMLIRGPGISPGSVSREPVANQDIAPTVLNLTGARAARRMDGRTMARFWQDPDRLSRRPLLLSSYAAATPLVPSDYPRESLSVGAGRSDATASATVGTQNYAGVRLGPYKYVEYESGERELYVLSQDPAELENCFGDPAYGRIVRYLDRELDRLRACRAADCRTPSPRWPPPPVLSADRTG